MNYYDMIRASIDQKSAIKSPIIRVLPFLWNMGNKKNLTPSSFEITICCDSASHLRAPINILLIHPVYVLG